jgi:signal transduction histidine kinase
LKSIFAKYVITFTVLLLVSFLLLLLIVDSVVSNFTLRAGRRDTRGVAAACAENLGEIYAASGSEDFRGFMQAGTATGVREDGYIHRLLNAILTNFEDMTVYVTDASGGFIFSTGKAADAAPTVGTVILNERELSVLRGETEGETETAKAAVGVSASASEASSEETSAVGTFLWEHPLLTDKKSYAYALPVTGEEQAPVGYILVVSAAETWNTLMNTTVRSVTVAALWIFLAALIAIYFITERTVAPLRDMSRAVKKMAVGQYDVRVRVYGRDEVAELAAAFNQMAESLENLERMRNSFVANVSHDLRTPMTTISGFVDGILDGVIPPEQQKHYLTVVSGEVRRLSRLVTALLDVSRLQAGDRKFDMKPFDICEMGRQILISFEQKIDSKGLDVEFECDEDNMYVLADMDAIHQILYNICDNAVKFSSERGKLKMSFAWSAGGLGRPYKAAVTVYNEGQGIPAEDLPFVFERFYKSDKSRGLDKTGVGLGMFISKTIIEAHGETISVDSEYGKYCSFTFTLARTEPPAQKARALHTQGGTHE